MTAVRETTAWREGAFYGSAPRLLFGRTHEDSAIELQAFPPASRVFCIAGAGDTARALAAAGHTVTAVDINPVQVDYARARAFGAPPRTGVAERLTGFARRLLTVLGCTRSARREFLAMDDPAAQLAWFRRHLDGPLCRAVMDAGLSRPVLRLAYRGPFLDALPPAFGAHLRARLRRGFATHPNRTNPHAWQLLLGGAPSWPEPAPIAPMHFACADAASFLDAAPPRSFDAFTLSNITDGASPAYIRRLFETVHHAAAPEATVVTRSFAETGAASPNFAAADRSLIWGSVLVEHLQ
jgi:S-adenosylmethionine:diacylglycerol 3-amino-3-carboxypropyl transferase